MQQVFSVPCPRTSWIFDRGCELRDGRIAKPAHGRMSNANKCGNFNSMLREWHIFVAQYRSGVLENRTVQFQYDRMLGIYPHGNPRNTLLFLIALSRRCRCRSSVSRRIDVANSLPSRSSEDWRPSAFNSDQSRHAYRTSMARSSARNLLI